MKNFPEYLRAVPFEELASTSINEGVIADWAFPRFGNANPERMDNPLWELLIRSRIEAYQAGREFNIPSNACGARAPRWCFARFGRASVWLPDGRLVQISGEHEDHYDPDFCIYNDVVVWHPDGRIEIYGYPEEVFPPTDFHSATLIGDRIVVIGNLGYPSHRKPGQTPIKVLNLADFSITSQPTTNSGPGWIFEHDASWDEASGAIRITGGKVEQNEKKSHVENFDEWSLDIASWTWECRQTSIWQQFAISRKDGLMIHGWDFSLYISYHDYANRPDDWFSVPPLKSTAELEALEDEALKNERLGNYWECQASISYWRLQEQNLSTDVALMRSLYHPPHFEGVLGSASATPEEDSLEDEGIDDEDYHRMFPAEALKSEFGVHRVQIQGVPVCYKEDSMEIIVTIEGVLPENTVQALLQDLRDKLTKLERSECVIEVLR